MRRGFVVVACVLCTCAATTSSAVTATQVPIGPRAIGLGGAFSAVADDASAAFWNPAGLAQVGHQEFVASDARFFGTSLRDHFAAFVLPLSPALAAATDWYHSGYDDGELGFRENRIDLGFGVEVRPRWFAGLNAKLLTRSLELDATSLSASRGFGLDAGVLGSPWERLRIGAAVQDVFGTRLQSDDGNSQVAYPASLRLGASYAFRRWGTLAAQVDDRWHIGFEGTPHAQLALRGGVQADRHDSEGPTWSAGLGLRAGVLRLDWAREFPPTLASTDHFAAAFEFNFNPPLVRVEKPRVEEIYASLQRSYAHQPIGSMRVRNLQDRPIEATVSVLVPELMDRPSEQQVVLRPRALNEVSLTAALSDRVLALQGDRPVQVQVVTSYQSRRLVRRERSTAPTVAYAPGALDWSRGMAQAAAFVTPRDPVVEALSRQAARVVLEGPLERFPNRNVALIAAMTDALATVGVAYVPDPHNPFATVSESPHAVDTIYYPFQTLQRRTGDCDDTTVLLASLLGSVGIATQFVDAPGHILLVAGTGLDENLAPALGVDSTAYVVRDHEVWLPLETTVSSRGFVDTWRTGAVAVASDSVRFVDVEESQQRFEPVLPPGERTPVTLDESRFTARLATSARTWEAWRDSSQGSESIPIAVDAMLDVAHIRAEAGDLTGARARLEGALAGSPRSTALHNDLGVALVGLDSLERAESHFFSVLALGEASAGAWLNLGVVRWLRGDSAAAAPILARGVRLAGSRERAMGYLGLSSSATGYDDRGDDTDRRIEAVLHRALDAAGRVIASGKPEMASLPRLAPRDPQSRAPLTPSGPHWFRYLHWMHGEGGRP